MSFRDEKLKMRRRLHDIMQVPALYLKDQADYAGTEITVRPHTKFMALGDQKGTSFNSAEIESIAPKLILWRDQLPEDPPQRGRIISVEPGEAYYIDHVEEADGPTYTAHVTVISADAAKGLAVPKSTDCC